MELGICVNVVNPDLFFYSSTDVAVATNFGQNWWHDLYSAPWHLKTDWNVTIWISSFIAQMIPTSCTNCVNFGQVMPEIEVWEICTFETLWQKAVYLIEFLNNYWTDLHQRFSFGRRMYGDYKTDISFALWSKGRWYGNQLILGHFCRRQN